MARFSGIQPNICPAPHERAVQPGTIASSGVYWTKESSPNYKDASYIFYPCRADGVDVWDLARPRRRESGCAETNGWGYAIGFVQRLQRCASGQTRRHWRGYFPVVEHRVVRGIYPSSI